MKTFYLVSYEVSGIKSIGDPVELSFYKKNASKNDDTNNFHIKGIYGMNGTGKTGIITSVKFLKGLLLQSNYLYNPLIQQQLSELTNKKSNSLQIKIEFLFNSDKVKRMYLYEVEVSRSELGFYISHESLSIKNATNRSSDYKTIITVDKGSITSLDCSIDKAFSDELSNSVINLLDRSTIASIFNEKITKYSVTEAMFNLELEEVDTTFLGLAVLNMFANSLCVYLDDSDRHIDYYWNIELENSQNESETLEKLLENVKQIERCDRISYLSPGTIHVHKNQINNFRKKVFQLEKFLKRFKNELVSIEIEEKPDHDFYVCSLNMRYKDYKINTEFESTGIKKLIKLYMYFRRMVNGDIVFIDEFDSNIHDVYLCALLEYMMYYGEGQLIFTTHNVGPMNILQKGKKSIDFLSVDHQIYSWKNNGNYSAAKLYREGMIEGSPFNIEAIDFIGLFEEEDN